MEKNLITELQELLFDFKSNLIGKDYALKKFNSITEAYFKTKQVKDDGLLELKNKFLIFFKHEILIQKNNNLREENKILKTELLK